MLFTLGPFLRPSPFCHYSLDEVFVWIGSLTGHIGSLEGAKGLFSEH
jgi:hypothetical protein